MPFLFEDDQKTIISLDAAMQPIVTRLTTNFQNKINAIYEKLVTLGSTPSAKTPEAITNAIQAINDSIFNKLVSLGQTPTGKTVANLNAGIQALTEKFWYFNRTYDGSTDYMSGRYDMTNVAELYLTSYVSVTHWPLNFIFYNAGGSVVGREEVYATGAVAIPSTAKYCDVVLLSTYVTSANLRIKYQTKVLR